MILWTQSIISLKRKYICQTKLPNPILRRCFAKNMKKGKNANWESVTAERVGLSRNAFIEVGKELKRKGYLPNFSTTKSNNADIIICFIGEPSDEAKRLFEEINAE